MERVVGETAPGHAAFPLGMHTGLAIMIVVLAFRSALMSCEHPT
jgi:hypothetical protein